MNWARAAIVLLAALGVSGCIFGQSSTRPAVSRPNAKMSFSGGSFNSTTTGLAGGVVTVPLGKRGGAQLDGVIGSKGHRTIGGVGGHLFTRDPAIGLVGAIASFNRRGSFKMGRVGAEGELYKGRFTLAGAAGYQFLDVIEGGFMRVELRYYPHDDLVFSIGGELQAGGVKMARFKAEWQPKFARAKGISLFAIGQFGTNNAGLRRAVAGIKVYFGKAKSLIRRHREDDPINGTIDDQFAMTGYNSSDGPPQPTEVGVQDLCDGEPCP